VAGTIVALDPDIPPARQRLVFERDGRGHQPRWVLDGADLGADALVVSCGRPSRGATP
jgi:penicillin-binding protein 1C